MKGNVENLVALAQQVESIEKRKEDYLYNTKDIEMSSDGESISLKNGSDVFKVNDNAHQQIASKLDIPVRYYNKMQEVPGLRAQNVNAWFQKKPERRLIRTLDGNARAFLSDRFKPVDNHMILSGFLPILKDMQVQVKSCSLTDTKMYLQVVFPATQKEVIPGDPVQFGVTLTNSEVGRGAVAVKSTVWRLVCSNGMITENLLNKYHVGRRVGEDIQDYDIFQDDTIIAELESFKKRLRDIFLYCLKQSYFESIVTKMRNATEDKIENVNETIGKVTKRFFMTDKEGEKILINIGKELGKVGINATANRWMLSNSITALAHDIEDQERQYEYEKTGWNVLSLPKKQWQEVCA